MSVRTVFLSLFLVALPVSTEAQEAVWPRLNLAGFESPSLNVFGRSSFLEAKKTPLRRYELGWKSLGRSNAVDVFVRSSSLVPGSTDETTAAAPSKTAMVAGFGMRLGKGWKMETELGSAQQIVTSGKARPSLMGRALRWNLAGQLGGIQLKASFQDVSKGFQDPGDKSLRAGRRSHLQFERKQRH